MTSSHRRQAASASILSLLLATLAPACGDPGTSSTGGSGGSGGSTGGTTTTGGTAGSTGGATGGTGGAAPAPDLQDILSTDIALDLGALTGAAKVVAWPTKATGKVALEVGGLTVSEVLVDGAAGDYMVDQGMAAITITDGTKPATIDIKYSFQEKGDTFDGWMPGPGLTFLWPYFCSNLFPCDSHPDDGAVFTMSVTGYDPALTAVYPTTTTSDAPSYMPAVAVGDFIKQDLGKTTAGTSISSWFFAGQEADAAAGTANLKAVVDFYEKTYGPYSFGKETGSVSAKWGPGAFGGMEHHPYVHVAFEDFGNEEVHAHEAAHGWYGDGVRIACWEDFMLSEGTVTYMAAHSLERVGGPDLWPSYVDSLDLICTGQDVNTVALPDTCNAIDLLNDPLWSLVPYIKGACFYEDVADVIGQDALDGALSEFYAAHVGRAAHMQDMIDLLKTKATQPQQATIDTLVTEWLRTEACPANYATRCGTHQNP